MGKHRDRGHLQGRALRGRQSQHWDKFSPSCLLRDPTDTRTRKVPPYGEGQSPCGTPGPHTSTRLNSSLHLTPLKTQAQTLQVSVYTRGGGCGPHGKAGTHCPPSGSCLHQVRALSPGAGGTMGVLSTPGVKAELGSWVGVSAEEGVPRGLALRLVPTQGSPPRSLAFPKNGCWGGGSAHRGHCSWTLSRDTVPAAAGLPGQQGLPLEPFRTLVGNPA